MRYVFLYIGSGREKWIADTRYDHSRKLIGGVFRGKTSYKED